MSCTPFIENKQKYWGIYYSGTCPSSVGGGGGDAFTLLSKSMVNLLLVSKSLLCDHCLRVIDRRLLEILGHLVACW